MLDQTSLPASVRAIMAGVPLNNLSAVLQPSAAEAKRVTGNSADLINVNQQKRNEDWSRLANQVVGAEVL